MYRIESDIPQPVRQRGRAPKYPFADMKPGDSFAVDVGREEPRVVLNRINTAAQGWRRRNAPEAHFIVETSKDHKEVRIWLADPSKK